MRLDQEYLFYFEGIKMSNEQNELQQYRTQIHRIFVFYCSFADKESYSQLKIQNYRRFILDLHLKEHSNLAPQLDLIFYSHSHSTALQLHTFTNALQHIAALAFPDIPKENRLQKFLGLHISPLYETIVRDTDFGRSMSFISAVLLKESCFIFLKRFEGSLATLYKIYFNEQSKAGKQQEFKMFTKLSRELNLVPRVTSKPVSYLIFEFLRDRSSKSAFEVLFVNSLGQGTKSYGFNFVCFLEYLIILSQLNSKNDEKQQLKLYRLLQLMEVSPGCQALSKKIKFQHFYLTQSQLSEAISENKPEILFNSYKSQVKQTKKVQSPVKRKLAQYYVPLKNKFIDLCLKRHVQTNFYLPAATAKRVLEKICPKLTGVTIELLIASVGKLNFDNFVKLLAKAAEKLGVSVQMLYDQVLLYNTEHYDLKIILQNVKLTKKQEITCRQILRLSQNYLRSIYDYYESNGGLSMNVYLKLLQQVGLIPSVVAVAEAADIYRISSQKEDGMSLNQFQDSFMAIIVAIHFDFQLEGPQRLIYLLQKISESKRGEVLMKKNLLLVKEHPLYMLRLTFNSAYKEIQKKLEFNNRSVLTQSNRSDQ